ncbi:MAG: AAA family ATPase [Fusobacteriaceae bacterium]|jgi:ATP-dependent exoDNAse (exonuclease V) alpha subunit|nr:AAA family ATPase [Fusobacteriaceae bacterium]
MKNNPQSSSKLKSFTTPQKKPELHESADVREVVLGEEQAKVYDIMENTNQTMYITGKAGSGKSFLLQYFMRNSKKRVAAVAPTGVAALNINGQTIHSFFRLKLEAQNPDDAEQTKLGIRQRAVLRAVDAIVIDEVSMLRVDIIDMIDKKLQLANGNSLPFGGKQLFLFGDLYQLPPVVDSGQLSRYLEDKYGSIFFFRAPAFKRVPLLKMELNHIYRQTDTAFIGILNDVRIGKLTANCLDALNTRCVVPSDRHRRFITITARNDTAANINNKKLESIERQEYSYEAEITGDIKQSAFPTEKKLRLRVGAQVMMLKNDQTDSTSPEKKEQRRWVNGTLGIVSELGPDSVKVMIDGVEHSIDKQTWEKVQYAYSAKDKVLESRAVATFTQYPIRLAWAITIHKAQGQTYQSVMVDLEGGAFAAGQTYVALSRCVEMNGLYLNRPIRKADVIISQEVLEYMGDIS